MGLRAVLRRVRERPRSSHPANAAGTLRLELARTGPSPLSSTPPRPDALHIATIVPSFRRGSGGHATIVRLLGELRSLGHSVSIWLEDGDGRHQREPDSVTRQSFHDFFDAGDLQLQTDMNSWRGADLVLATGWQTVARALLLPDVHARAYLVQDHEPDFYAASAEALWAEQTYGRGLHCIAASAWLAELLRSRYGASTTHFDLGVDHTVYAGPSSAGEPASATAEGPVVFYARAVTPRRAVPLGLLALEELSRRRPDLEIALFGEGQPAVAAFEHRQLGVLDSRALAQLYSRASIGMVLSLTNPSLIGLEMMACGLPCVELASESMLATFGRDGPLELADPDPLALCAAIERLLDDPAARARAARAGLELTAGRTWTGAARQLEAGILEAIADRAAS